MNNIKYIILLVFMTSNWCNSQEFNFDLYNISLERLIKYEQSIGSELVENSSNYLNGKGIAQPIIFHRKYREIPNLKVQYTFHEKDSSMYKILYEWDISTFQKIDNNPKDSVFLIAMLAQFNKINNLIDSTYSSAKTEMARLNMEEINSSKGYKLTNEWQPNDSLKIKNHITLKNSFEKKKFSKSPTVHRIRTYINKLVPSPSKELDEKTIIKFDSITSNFIEILGIDKSKTYEYLSEEIVDKITDEQISQLHFMFEDAKPFKTIASGTEIGNNYQYPFIILSGKSNSMNRNVTIKIIYDKKNKIIGIK